MSYAKKTWKTGDTITAAALNNLETGASANAEAIADIEAALPTYVGEKVTRKAAATITPGTADQTIAANQYLTGALTIKGDGNLSAGNIKKGTAIFGVTGTLEAGSTGTDTSDATATTGDILNGKTAYVKGEKVTGTITIKGAQVYTPRATDQTILAGYYLKGNQTIEGDANLIADNIKKGVSIFGVAGTYVGSGGSGGGGSGSTVKTGSFTGTASEVAIETGLSSISAFMVYDTASSLHAEGLVCAFIDAEGGISGRGIGCTSYSSYFKNVGVSDTNVLKVSGGTITVLASSTGYKPISNATYKWYAGGEA